MFGKNNFLKVFALLTVLTFALGFSGCDDGGSKPGTNTTLYKVNIPATANGTVTSSPTGEAQAGRDVLLVISPIHGFDANHGYRLKEGSLSVKDAKGADVALTGSDNNRGFKMPASDVTVSAEFELIPDSIFNIVLEDLINGTIMDHPEFAEPGEEVTLTISPIPGFGLVPNSLKVIERVVDPHKHTPRTVSVSGSGSAYTFTMPAYNVTVSAEFAELPEGIYSVSIDEHITYGLVEVDKIQSKDNETITITITPDNKYQFKEGSLIVKTTPDDVTVSTSGTGNTRTFTMPASNVTITAEFERITYAINLAPMENGHVTVESNRAAEDDHVVVTIVPDVGYRFKQHTLVVKTTPSNIDIEVHSGGAGNLRQFVMPNSAVTISAVFEEIPDGYIEMDFEDLQNEEIDPGVADGFILSSSGTLVITIGAGFEILEVWIDGVYCDDIYDDTFTLNGGSYGKGPHFLSIICKKDGIPYSKVLRFTIE